MEESDTEAAETEPLVPTNTVGNNINTGTVGATTPAQKPLKTPIKSLPSRHRLSLVPENNEDETKNGEEKPKSIGEEKRHIFNTAFCPFFGVRNYLHNFYERDEVTNPALYEDYRGVDQVLLVRRDGGCSSTTFRLSLILGILLLLLGATAFTIAAFAARANVIASQVNMEPTEESLSQQAQIDALLLVGLVAATLGCTTLAAALVTKTFCTRNDDTPQPFHLSQYPLEPPISPSDKKVPTTHSLTQVQPSPALIPYP